MHDIFNLSGREALDVLRRWHASFVPKGELRRRGVPTQYVWHAFSYEVVRSTHGAAAVADYSSAAASANLFFVISGVAANAAAGQYDGPAPYFHGRDIIVSPPALAWTMAFTHEAPIIGPFFARRPS